MTIGSYHNKRRSDMCTVLIYCNGYNEAEGQVTATPDTMLDPTVGYPSLVYLCLAGLQSLQDFISLSGSCQVGLGVATPSLPLVQ